MNKNIFKKILATFMVLAITLVSFQHNSISYADTNLENNEMEIVYQSDRRELPYLEIVEANGITYYYKEDAKSFKSFSHNSDYEIIDAFYREKDNDNSMISYTIPKGHDILEYTALQHELKSISDLGDTFDYVFENIEELNATHIELNNVLADSDSSTNTLNIGINSSESNRAINKAKAVHGAPFLNKFRLSASYFNKTGYLYESLTYGAYKATNKYIAAGLAASAIAIALGIPPTSVKAVVSLVVGAAGTLISLKAETVRVYKTTVYKLKEVKVNNIYPYRSMRDIVGEVHISSTGITEFHKKQTINSDNIFGNHLAIIKRGCELSN